jgi:hypothetical protein
MDLYCFRFNMHFLYEFVIDEARSKAFDQNKDRTGATEKKTCSAIN